MSKKTLPIERVARSIMLVRRERVLLDYELSALYGIDTRALKQAVRRNRARFPGDFMFELSSDEIELLVSQSVIPSRSRLGGARPMAFTQEGVAMLSSVLKSERAVKVNIAIMRAFVKLREALDNNRQLAGKFAELERRVGRHDEDIAAILEAIRQLITPPQKPRREIGFHVRERSARYRAGNGR